jgi:hypothetical protein
MVESLLHQFDFLINLSKYTLQIQEFLYCNTTIAFYESTES